MIGKGSFGQVYHAMNAETGEFFAVKQIEYSPSQINKQVLGLLRSLSLEIQLLRDLENENVVQYLGFQVTECSINIFLEYVSGGSIKSLIKQHGPLADPVVRSFMKQISNGLEYLHERNILHRDIKGANILVDCSGVCKISDFGISRRTSDGTAEVNSRMSMAQGTWLWMAPECAKTTDYTSKVDIWSLGCVMLEMWTGKPPWDPLDSTQVLFKLTSNEQPSLPTDLYDDGMDLLMLLLEINPEKRITAKQAGEHRFCEVPQDYSYETFYEPKATPTWTASSATTAVPTASTH
ncbi:kinase-like protein [Ramicandelaber brevisporus]|nr:kinase-like protein [Ramicandelaber brevisporus]